jgi:DNA-binding NarL/FixJ family response regulator
LTILLVEDDEKVRSGLARFLRSHGIEVTESGSADVGLLNAAVVVAGYKLPEKNLRDLVESRKVSHPDSPVIVLVRGSMDLPFSRHEIDAINIRERTGELLQLLRDRHTLQSQPGR